MHKPTLKSKLERWVAYLSSFFDKWYDDMDTKYNTSANHPDIEDESAIWEINEMLGFKSDPENLKRFIK